MWNLALLAGIVAGVVSVNPADVLAWNPEVDEVSDGSSLGTLSSPDDEPRVTRNVLLWDPEADDFETSISTSGPTAVTTDINPIGTAAEGADQQPPPRISIPATDVGVDTEVPVSAITEVDANPSSHISVSSEDGSGGSATGWGEWAASRVGVAASVQPAVDRERIAFVPNMKTGSELVPSLGIVDLGPLLGRSAFGAVFSVIGHSDIAIKYQADCQYLGRNPLLIDYWLGRAAAPLNVSAIPHFLSPPAPLPLSSGWKKTRFGMNATEWDTCRTSGGEIRFMVMERVGGCLHSLKHDRGGSYMSILDAARVGAQLVKILRTLHMADVVHGDIHLGNICRSRTNPGELRLIDFGSGVFIDAESDRPQWDPFSYLHVQLTPWQLLGMPFSRRDDVYKALYAVAELMVGRSLHAIAERYMESKPERLLRWKRSYFFRTPTYDPIAAATDIAPESKVAIEQELVTMIKRVLSLESVETPIPYGWLFRGFHNIVKLAQAKPPTTTTTDSPENADSMGDGLPPPASPDTRTNPYDLL